MATFIAIGASPADPPPADPAFADPAFADPLAEERAVLAELRAEGVVTAVYLRGDGGGVISVVAAADRDQAATQLGRLPFVRDGRLTFDLVEVTELPR